MYTKTLDSFSKNQNNYSSYSNSNYYNIPESKEVLANLYQKEISEEIKKHADLIKVFATLIPDSIPEWLKELKRQTCSLWAGYPDSTETIKYRNAGHSWLWPRGIRFSRKLKVAIFGNHYLRHSQELLSVFSIETLSKKGTLADPHIHYLCEAHPLLTEDLVRRVWADVTECSPKEADVKVSFAPFDKGTLRVIDYIFKYTSYDYPADVYPYSINPPLLKTKEK
ncbi:hypothetical protein JXM67_04505 [candidate division WOR-3 bacterium]|nr:hypothetical protein [candidate division WOR-3 bacterium]